MERLPGEVRCLVKAMSGESDAVKNEFIVGFMNNNMTKKPEERLEFGRKPINSASFCYKARFGLIGIPTLLYFAHIFLISV